MGKLFRLLLVLLVLVGAATGVYAFTRSQKKENGLKLVEATVGSITEKAVAVGQIQPRQKFSVKSKISGIVKSCRIEVGDFVKAGDPLFEIAPDPTPLEQTEVDRQVDSAQASFVRAKVDFERAVELQRQGIIPKSDVDSRRESYELAKIALEKAQQNRALTRSGRVVTASADIDSIIRAPSAGTILTRTVNPGDPVVPLTSYQPGTEMATIADMKDLIFKGTVDEIDVGKLRVPMLARIKVGALPTDVVTGHVSRIAPQAQQKEGATLFDVEIELDPSAERDAPGRLLGERRPDHPREEGDPDDPRAARDLRGRREEDLRRASGGKPQGRAEEGPREDRHLRRPERGSPRRV